VGHIYSPRITLKPVSGVVLKQLGMGAESSNFPDRQRQIFDREDTVHIDA